LRASKEQKQMTTKGRFRDRRPPAAVEAERALGPRDAAHGRGEVRVDARHEPLLDDLLGDARDAAPEARARRRDDRRRHRPQRAEDGELEAADEEGEHARRRAAAHERPRAQFAQRLGALARLRQRPQGVGGVHDQLGAEARAAAGQQLLAVVQRDGARGDGLALGRRGQRHGKPELPHTCKPEHASRTSASRSSIRHDAVVAVRGLIASPA
jgi:hypothetical protein